jgi:hypothetical protein
VVGTLRLFRKRWVGPGIPKRNGQVWVAGVRNPFDYYVSLWSFNQQRHQRHGVHSTLRRERRASDQKATDILPSMVATPVRWRRARPHRRVRSKAVSGADREGKGARVGLATYRSLKLAFASPDRPDWSLHFEPVGVDERAEWLRAHSRVDVTIRLEPLSDDLCQLIETSGVEFHDGALERLQVAKPVNTSRHAPPMEFYDAATEAMVRQRDQILLELFYPNR